MSVHEVVYMRYGKYRRPISLKTYSEQKPIGRKSCYGREKSIARNEKKGETFTPPESKGSKERFQQGRFLHRRFGLPCLSWFPRGIASLLGFFSRLDGHARSTGILGVL